MNRTRAEELSGGHMFPSKMDCPSWAISATRCKMGSLLSLKKGSVCHPDTCYAKKGTFRFSNVQAKLERSYLALIERRGLWTPAMVTMIRWYAEEKFRWFTSGDVQGIAHLRNIIQICLATPAVMHWLPTHEGKLIQACQDEIPDNLTIRLSGARVDGPAPRTWPYTSTVVTDEAEATCPASINGGNCTDNGCDACWDRSVQNVAYRKH